METACEKILVKAILPSLWKSTNFGIPIAAFRRKITHIEFIMTLTTDEFIHRLLLQAPPSRIHRIRYYGLFANGRRARNLDQTMEEMDRFNEEVRPLLEF